MGVKEDISSFDVPVFLYDEHSQTFELNHCGQELFSLVDHSPSAITDFLSFDEQPANAQSSAEQILAGFANILAGDKKNTTVNIFPNPSIPNTYFIFPLTNQQEKKIANSSKLEKLNDAINGAKIGIWEYDIKHDVCTFSDFAIQMLRCSNDLNWPTFKQLFVPSDLTIFESFIQNHFKYDIPLHSEVRLLINGEVQWFSISGNKFIEDGQALITGSIVDITREKIALQQLTRANESRRLAMTAGEIGTWNAESEDGKHWTWDWDNQASEIFQFNTKDAGDINLWVEQLHPEDKETVSKALFNSLRTGVEFREKYRAILPNKKIIYVYSIGAVGKDIDGKNIRIDGVCIDQTHIVQAQKQLTKLNTELEERVKSRTLELELARDKAEQASQTKSQFLAMMSHELRTPMNAIVGSLDLLALSVQDAESSDLIETAITSANNLILILNDILDINKIEAGKLDLEASAISVNEIIDNVLKIFIPVAAKKGITLEVVEDPNIPNFIEGDLVRLKQILLNLLGNAIKFTETTETKHGKVTLKAELTEIQAKILHFKFSITDNGIGMTSESVKKLFTPFTQAELSTTRKYGGTGLGLAICGKLVDMMGGHIEVNSEFGHGSVFSVSLPMWSVEEAKNNSFTYLEHKSVLVINASKDLALKTEIINQNLKSAHATSHIKTWHEHDTLSTQELNCDTSLLLVEDLVTSFDVIKFISEQLPEHNKLTVISWSPKKKYQIEAGLCHKIINAFHLTKTTLLRHLDHVLSQPKVTHVEDNDELDISLDFDLPLVESPKLNNVLKKGILLVEDNPLNQKLFLKQLAQLGYSCDIAEDGIKGLNSWINNQEYKLILTDCHMPNMDGYEMTKQIRAKEQEQSLSHKIPIVAVTGAAMAGDEAYCRSLGMCDFISKPIQLKDFKKVLDKWYPNEYHK